MSVGPARKQHFSPEISHILPGGLVLRKATKQDAGFIRSELVSVLDASPSMGGLGVQVHPGARTNARVMSDLAPVVLVAQVAKAALLEAARSGHGTRLTWVVPTTPAAMLRRHADSLLDGWLRAGLCWVAADPNSDALAGCCAVDGLEGRRNVVVHLVAVKRALMNKGVATSMLGALGITSQTRATFGIAPPACFRDGVADPIRGSCWRNEWLARSRWQFDPSVLWVGTNKKQQQEGEDEEQEAGV